jgi:lysophospholipase L1-like esterase
MADSNQIKKTVKVIAILSAGLFTLVIGFGLVEVLLRWWQPLQIRMRGKRILLQKNKIIQNTYAFNSPKISNHIIIKRNSLGFRGPEPPINFKDRVSLVAVGGSTTECIFVTEGKTWTDIVQSKLEKDIPNIWINNAGIDGHSSCGHLEMMDQYLGHIKPNYVMFLVGINDLAVGNCRIEDGKTLTVNRGGELGKVDEWLLSNSMIYTYIDYWKNQRIGHDMRALADSIVNYNVLGTSDYFDIVDKVEDQKFDVLVVGYQDRLRKLMNKTLEYGIRPILITQPAVYGFGIDPTTGVDLGELAVSDFTEAKVMRKGSEKWALLERYNEATRKVALEKGVALIDLANKLPKDTKYFYDYVHYTESGSEKVGEIVAEGLKEILTKNYK